MLFMEAYNMSAKSWYRKKYTPEQIKEIQRTLGVEEDGLIGPDTINAIKEYQEAVGLKADGLWGKSTQAKADEWNAQYDSIQPTFGKGKDTDDLKEAAYKQYSDNLENRYFLDEQNKYESNFKPNYEITNVELAQLNAEIDKVKKQLAARQSKYEEVPRPKTQVGWSSYIVNNDRGMLDKYQDTERNWYTLKEQERHAKELADKQRAQQDMMNMDENMKNRSIAAINYQYAQQALKLDNSRDPATKAMLEQKAAEAKATLDYWNKRTGLVDKDVKKELKNEVKTEVKESEEAPKGTTLAVDIADIDMYISGKKKFATIKEQQDLIKKAKADPAYNTDANYRDKVNSLEVVKSIEAIKKADEANKTKWRNEYNALTPLQQRLWKKNNPTKAKAIGV